MRFAVCFAILLVVQSIRLVIKDVQLKAFVYFIVDKGYTEPTEEEMVQYIRIVVKKMIKEKF